MGHKKRMFAVIFLFTIFWYAQVVAEMAKPQGQLSRVVLVAHGSNNEQLQCNSQVEALYDSIKDDDSLPPITLAFLRFPGDKTLAKAVAHLGINDRVLLIHLAPSSFSIRHIELTESIAQPGSVRKPWFYKIIHPHNLPSRRYAVSPAMDDDPNIVQILINHAREILSSLQSSDGQNPVKPEEVSLMLVSYGAIEELENILWDRVMERVGETIRRDIGFREVASISLRNHSADLIKEQSISTLIKMAKRLKEQGKVIVVPYVLCEGAFQRNLKSYLDGIISPENISSKGVLSDLENTASWVRDVIQRGMNQPPQQAANRNWSLMDIEKGNEIGTNKYGSCEP